MDFKLPALVDRSLNVINNSFFSSITPLQKRIVSVALAVILVVGCIVAGILLYHHWNKKSPPPTLPLTFVAPPAAVMPSVATVPTFPSPPPPVYTPAVGVKPPATTASPLNPFSTYVPSKVAATATSLPPSMSPYAWPPKIPPLEPHKPLFASATVSSIPKPPVTPTPVPGSSSPEISKPTPEEIAKIKALKAQWLDDSAEELKRLQALGMLNPSLQDYAQNLGLHDQPGQDQFKVIIGRIQELKKEYEKTHYVFTHGQGKGLCVINKCVKKLLKQLAPDLYNALSMPLRMPFSVDHTANVAEFFKKYPLAEQSSAAFNDDELNKKTAELLSVDTYMWNQQGYESALYFFAHGTNINMNDSSIGEKILTNIFTFYLHDAVLCKIMANKAWKLAGEHSIANRLGTLWAICIPKAVVEDPARNFAYRSHAYGRKCNCHPAHKDIEILKQLQKEQTVTCTAAGHPQYRLLTARLQEEAGVRALPVNGLTKEKNKEFNQRINNLVREVALYAQIANLTKPISEPEAEPLIKEINDLKDLNQLDAKCLEQLLYMRVDMLSSAPNLCVKIQETVEALQPKHGSAI